MTDRVRWIRSLAGCLLLCGSMGVAHANEHAVSSQRTAVLPLSGMGQEGEAPVYWDFHLDSGRGSGQWTRIRVPSCWEQEGFGAYYYGTQGRGKDDADAIIPKEEGRYRTQFSVPAEWQGRAVRIVFEGAMTDTTVQINGQSAGPTHQGGFYRFHYDITSLVRYGAKNLLEVAVRKESANQSVNRAERRGDYWTFGGIYRPVWLEARPAQHIEWTAIDARADGSFYAQVHLGSAVAADRSLHAQVTDGHGTPVGPRMSASIAANGTSAVIMGRIANPSTWSAEAPHLYQITFSLQRAAAVDGKREAAAAPAVAHEVTERFGFRTFEVRPRDGLYLNGRKIRLKGINRHSFSAETGRTLTREKSYADARLIKDANMNAVRMSHYPPDPHFLEAADELGLYVLDELAGWQGSYDTPTAARLIGQIVRRDVNHPSILFWDNGNEGGWNREVDGEFDRWDPQRRAVLHPWAIHSGINTDHYENYASTVRLSRGPDIFMPTEFLHGLYDGGIGAGLRDYWDVMSSSPTVAGGFFWAFADEGIARSDRNGRIDTLGNSAPDGIVGPRGEKEGSYSAVREIWSPVRVSDLRLDASRAELHMAVRNEYDFTNLNQCTIEWRTLRLPPPGGLRTQQVLMASGQTRGPDVGPREKTEMRIALAAAASGGFDVLHVIVRDPHGRELWTWALENVAKPAASSVRNATSAVTRSESLPGRVIVHSAPYDLTFDPASGLLSEVRKEGRSYPLGGPRWIAHQREERRFKDLSRDLSGGGRLRRLETRTGNTIKNVLAIATYDGPLRKVVWSRADDGIVMSYEYAFDGVVDILGVRFDLPESSISSKRWVGRGPYRIWQNRLEGGALGFHEVAYNDSIPGETYVYPEFKGFFGDWRWLALETSQGHITIVNDSDVPYFGLYKPQGGVQPLLDLPDVGVSFLTVIPAIGTKFDLPEVLGPQSQPRAVSGVQRGQLLFRFD